MVTEVDKGVNVSPVPEVVTVHLAMNIHIRDAPPKKNGKMWEF